MERKEPLATRSLADIDQKVKNNAAESGGAGGKKNEGPPAKQFLVLVVDDFVDNVVALSLDLQGEGYKVVTASNGEEAVSIASLIQPDIILMDISMPQLDGLAATRKIRENGLRDVPVIAITAFSTEGFRRAAYDVGVAGYLVKPIDFQRMHDLIRRLLAAKESGIDPGAA
ncbi:MAG: response regulator [Acidobacteriota bacterium]|nr:response regulator [Acidobacteriota bacterium]